MAKKIAPAKPRAKYNGVRTQFPAAEVEILRAAMGKLTIGFIRDHKQLVDNINTKLNK